jgi:hypothetical protein
LRGAAYPLSFPDIEALEAAWAKFGAHPDWKTLSSNARFKPDPPTVSNVTSLVLRPFPYLAGVAKERRDGQSGCKSLVRSIGPFNFTYPPVPS